MIEYKYPKIMLILIVLVFFTGSINAEVPGTMNYQSRLTDNAGNPVADSLYNVIFRIYDETNIKLWEESHQIATNDGLFSVQLGSNGSLLNANVFNHTECWLGVTVVYCSLLVKHILRGYSG